MSERLKAVRERIRALRSDKKKKLMVNNPLMKVLDLGEIEQLENGKYTDEEISIFCLEKLNELVKG